MFNGKAIGLLLVAVVFGIGAALFANKWLQQQVRTEVVKEDSVTVPILVAAIPIQYGQTLEDIHLKTVQWPRESVLETNITTPEEALGRIANQKILPGEPLSTERVVEQLEGTSLASLIGSDKRAVTVRVNDVGGVAGFLMPGSHVDILGSRKVNKRVVTGLVLQNVKVLAVDQTHNPEKDEPVVVRAVTVEADLDQSMKLVAATREGTVQMVLRNPEDIATRIQSKPKRKVARARQKDPTVRIIRGTSVGSTSVRN